MGMGGGGGNQGTTTSQLPPWAQQAGMRGLGTMESLIFGPNSMGYPNIYSGMPSSFNQQQAGFTPNQMAGRADIRNAANGPMSQLAGNANNLANQTLQGNFLNPSSNPQLRNFFNAAAQPMVANYQTATAPGNMAAAQQAGMFNSNASADQRLMSQYGLGNNLQQLAANTFEPAYQFERGQQDQMYQFERNNQMQTQQMMPTLNQASLAPGQSLFGLGSVQQQFNQQGMDIGRQNAISQFQFPYQLLSQLTGSIGPATGGQSITTSSGPGPSGK